MVSDDTPSPADASSSPDKVPFGSMRVSDAERNAAIEALGEHLTAGRITVDEYGERSARITVARTAAEVAELFEDLPEPHPALPTADGPANRTAAPVAARVLRGGVPVAPGPVTNTQPDARSTAQKLMGAAAAASVFVALALFFLTGLWYWFLLIPAISAIAGSIWGPDWKDGGQGTNRRRRELGR